MANDNEPEIRQLREIKQELKNIKGNTASTKWWILHGMLYGAGWIIGSLIAIISSAGSSRSSVSFPVLIGSRTISRTHFRESGR